MWSPPSEVFLVWYKFPNNCGFIVVVLQDESPTTVTAGVNTFGCE